MTVAEPIRDEPTPVVCGPCKLDKHHWHAWLKHRLEPCACDCRGAA